METKEGQKSYLITAISEQNNPWFRDSILPADVFRRYVEARGFSAYSVACLNPTSSEMYDRTYGWLGAQFNITGCLAPSDHPPSSHLDAIFQEIVLQNMVNENFVKKPGSNIDTPCDMEHIHNLLFNLPKISRNIQSWFQSASITGTWSWHALRSVEALLNQPLHNQDITSSDRLNHLKSLLICIALTSLDTSDWKKWWKNPQVQHFSFFGEYQIFSQAVLLPALLMGSTSDFQLENSTSDFQLENSTRNFQLENPSGWILPHHICVFKKPMVKNESKFST
eukprot:TRINITY_DN781_c0_g1_i1.p1 TRINITY_DN781_c0_g1~~TRINITY_DN781_c0_g1_i1.p1  ORF type:complete len:281 (+),score=54.81 TRINITY_DN781_c0_g1_i1:35-877(+)